MQVPAYVYHPGEPNTVLRGGLPNPVAGNLLATLTLANEALTEQPAGFVTKSFGQSFRKGDVPAGEWPQFKTAEGVVCPYTCWGKATWKDGSLKFLAAMVRFPQSVAAMGTRALRVYSGGSAPAAGALTEDDLVAFGLSVKMTGVTNLSGAWVADLNDAISRGDDVVQIGNGPAGAYWRIGSEVRDGSSVAHGQLYTQFYLFALLDSEGGIAGVRRLEHVMQLWADVASPAPCHRDMTIEVLVDGATVRTMQGYTVANGSLTNTARIPHYSSAFTATKSGHYEWVPGSAANDTAVRVLPDTSYVQQSYFVPTFDRSIPVDDAVAANYDIGCKGNHATYAMGGTGERAEVGLFPQWAAKYWINPSAANERAVRVNALATAGYEQEGRTVATKKPTPVVGPTLTGLGAPKTDWTIRPGVYVTARTPSPNAAIWQTDSGHRPAPAFSAYLATGELQYLDLLLGAAFGNMMGPEPNYRSYTNTRPITTSPIVYNGARGGRINNVLPQYPTPGVLLNGNGIRVGAWRFRDVGQCLGICPDQHPDGADYKAYLEFIVQDSCKFYNDFMAGQPEAFRESGLLILEEKSSPITTFGQSPWMDHYWGSGVAHTSVITENEEAIKARGHFAKRFTALDAVANPVQLGAYQYQGFTATGIVESFADVLFTNQTATLTFSTADNTVTVSGNASYGDWGFTNGDVFMFPRFYFPEAGQPYTTMGDYVLFHVVEAAGKVAKFSASPGGAVLPVIANKVFSNLFYCRLQTTAPGFSPGHVEGGSTSLVSCTGLASYLQALGEPVGVPAAKLRASQAINISPTAFNEEPKYKWLAEIPETTP